MQRIANVLVEVGFAAWEPNPRHRRAKLLVPTQQARTAINRVAELQHLLDAMEAAGAVSCCG